MLLKTLQRAPAAVPTETSQDVGVVQYLSAVSLLGARWRKSCSPYCYSSGSLQGTLASWFGLEVVEGGAGPEDTEFTNSLRRRLHRRMGAQLPGSVGLERGSVIGDSAGTPAEAPAEVPADAAL